MRIAGELDVEVERVFELHFFTRYLLDGMDLADLHAALLAEEAGPLGFQVQGGKVVAGIGLAFMLHHHILAYL